jgi:hypothetical protein
MRRTMDGMARTLAIVCFISLIAACSTFPTQEFNKSANANLHAIAVAPLGIPEKPAVIILNAVGNSFGLIGGIVEATRAANASNELVGELKTGNLDYKTYLPAHIITALQAEGFTIRAVDGARAQGETGKFLSKPPLPPDADATLDIYVSYVGYIAAGATTDYRPAVHIEARLLDRKTQKVLFADQIYYNNFSPNFAKQAISIEPDPAATFKDRAAMLAAPEAVARGLNEGLDAVSQELARQLK